MNHLRDIGLSESAKDDIEAYSPIRRSVAVIIGINQYQNSIPVLNTPVHDAQRLADILKTTYKYEQIYLLKDSVGEEIKQFLTEELPTLVDQNDRLLFYFAGHGIALESTDGKPEGYMVPADGNMFRTKETYLSMRDVQQWLEALPMRHLLVILDCCFAGTFKWAGTRKVLQLPEIQKERYERYTHGKAQQVLTSTGKNEEALDSFNKRFGKRENDDQQHSPFAAALFQALEGDEADLSVGGKRDGVITASELSVYLNQMTGDMAKLENDHQQTTQFWPLSRHEDGEFVFETPDFDYDKLKPAPEINFANNPYKGFSYFSEEDRHNFAGRDNDAEDLYRLITEATTNSTTGQIIVVTGPSSCGKTSLVRAGLIPKLKEEPTDWSIIGTIRPMVDALQDIKQEFKQWEQANQSDIRGSKKLLLVIDNFDILLTTQTQISQSSFRASLKTKRADVKRPFLEWRRERKAGSEDSFRTWVKKIEIDNCGPFFSWLDDKQAEFEGRLHLLFTANHDLLEQIQILKSCDDDSKKNNIHIYSVPPATQDTLREVIEKPAELNSIYFDPPELVDTLINEVANTPGALPLLSYTLSETYKAHARSKRFDRALNQADYNFVGGVNGVLSHNIDLVYHSLPDDEHRDTMRHILMRAVTPDCSRRRFPGQEIIYKSDRKNEQKELVISKLEEEGLVVRGHDLELAHDGLVMAWPIYKEWQREAAGYLPLQRWVTDAATNWEQEEKSWKKKRLLWNRKPQLGELKKVRKSNDNWLSKQESTFIDQSIKKEKRDRRLYWLSWVAICFTILSIFTWVLVAEDDLFYLRHSSENISPLIIMLDKVDAQQIDGSHLEKDEFEHALLMAKQGIDMAKYNLIYISPSFIYEEVSWLVEDLTKTGFASSKPSFVSTVALSPGGEISTSEQLTITVREHKTNEPNSPIPIILDLTEGHESWIHSIALSPDGNTLASASENDVIRLWNVSELNSSSLFDMSINNSNQKLHFASYPDASSLALVLGDHYGYGLWGDIQGLWNITTINSVASIDSDEFKSKFIEPISFKDENTQSDSKKRVISSWPTLDGFGEVACQNVSRNFSLEEWDTYMPEYYYDKTCSQHDLHHSLCDTENPDNPEWLEDTVSQEHLDEGKKLCKS